MRSWKLFLLYVILHTIKFHSAHPLVPLLPRCVSIAPSGHWKGSGSASSLSTPLSHTGPVNWRPEDSPNECTNDR